MRNESQQLNEYHETSEEIKLLGVSESALLFLLGTSVLRKSIQSICSSSMEVLQLSDCEVMLPIGIMGCMDGFLFLVRNLYKELLLSLPNVSVNWSRTHTVV